MNSLDIDDLNFKRHQIVVESIRRNFDAFNIAAALNYTELSINDMVLKVFNDSDGSVVAHRICLHTPFKDILLGEVRANLAKPINIYGPSDLLKICS